MIHIKFKRNTLSHLHIKAADRQTHRKPNYVFLLRTLCNERVKDCPCDVLQIMRKITLSYISQWLGKIT